MSNYPQAGYPPVRPHGATPRAVIRRSRDSGCGGCLAKIRVQGTFKGKTGPAIFVLDAETETLSRAKVDEIIGSME